MEFKDIYAVVSLIPKGRVSTYGAIARYLNSKNARLVGWALNTLKGNEEIPAHRVVNSQGYTTGANYFNTADSMENRLFKEGILVVNNKVQDFKALFWDPEEEL